MGRDSKVIRYPRPKGFNIGIAVFAVVLIYLAWNTASYALRDKIEYYEVTQKQSLASVDTFRALILRTERVSLAGNDGFVNYYIRGGSRAAVGDIICSIDETGGYNDLLRSGQLSQNTISGADFEQLKSALLSYSLSADKNNFSYLYDLKYSLESKLISQLGVSSGEAVADVDSSRFHAVTSSYAGLVDYTLDGYEGMAAEDVTADVFERGNYTSTNLVSRTEVSAGDVLFKTVTSDTWTMIVPLTSEQAERYSKASTLNAEFPDKRLSTYVRVNVFSGTDGLFYAKFTLSRFLPSFLDQRFTSVNISTEHQEGLVVPVSAVGEYDCYVIPRAFAQNPKSSSPVFMVTGPSGDDSLGEVISPRVVAVSEDNYYVDPESIPDGSVIQAYESFQTFTVSEKEALTGVYCVNRGYAQFMFVQVLDEDSEWVILQDGLQYSLTLQDRILKDFSDYQRASSASGRQVKQ